MPKQAKTRIMVFGTFDGVHKGHLDFFRQARGVAPKPFLIVSVSRDANVRKIKGKWPKNSEKKRLAHLRTFPFVDKAVLGGLSDHLPHIVRERPGIVALGYDQKSYTQNLRRNLTKKGLHVKILRLKAFMPQVYKSSKMNADRH